MSELSAHIDSLNCPLIATSSLKQFSSLAASMGVNGDAVLRRHQINSKLIESPQGKIRYQSLAAALNDAAEESGCDHFGLRLGETLDVATIDLVLACAQSDNLRDALANMGRYREIYGQGYDLIVHEERGYAYWKFYHAVSDDVDLSAFSDLTAMFMLKVLKFFLGDHSFSVSQAFLDRKEPNDPGPYTRILQAPCNFDRDFVGLKMPAEVLNHPLEANERLRDILFGFIEAGLPSLEEQCVVSQVSRQVDLLLPTGRCSIENIAQVLGIHPRTLQKKLQREKMVFRDILREKRMKKACFYLDKTALSVGAVAQAIGYSDTANFLRAFKAWFNTTPGEWRKRERAQVVS
ncbi:MAG: hypothetical protein CL693_07000 [Cellvibrionaceae bacterium]|nr:hypothetical protein [Cellvibrionaceae bacterium]|tara:strand:+ start:32336 stop:33382 length:1047 start_codon:yes stop_codon:yes gene_type:complete